MDKVPTSTAEYQPFFQDLEKLNYSTQKQAASCCPKVTHVQRVVSSCEYQHSHARSEHSCMLWAQPLLFLTLCWACYPPPSLILLTTGRVNMPTWWNIFMGQKLTSCGHKAQFLSIMTRKPMALSQFFGAENPSPPEILGAGFSPSMYIAHHFLAFGFCLALAWGFSRSLLLSFSFSFLKGTSNKGAKFFSGQTFQSKRILCHWCAPLTTESF